MAMDFTKMHGLGNDYIILDGIRQRIHLTPALVRKLCDRHRGIGADGVIMIMPAQKFKGSRVQRGTRPDFRMRIFNADGSEAEMCGNGIRCLGKFVYEHGLTRKKELLVATKSGNKILELFTAGQKVTKVKVAMGKPTEIANDGINAADEEFQVTRVNLGNPHCVIFTRDIDKLPIERVGPLIECHSKFSQRTNVEFVKILDKSNIKQRTWERGVGETMACGTGAAAAVAAAVSNKFVKPPVTVHLKGGDLLIDYTISNEIYLTGPAEEIYSGSIPL